MSALPDECATHFGFDVSDNLDNEAGKFFALATVFPSCKVWILLWLFNVFCSLFSLHVADNVFWFAVPKISSCNYSFKLKDQIVVNYPFLGEYFFAKIIFSGGRITRQVSKRPFKLLF